MMIQVILIGLTLEFEQPELQQNTPFVNADIQRPAQMPSGFG